LAKLTHRVVLHELYRSVFTKWEFSNTAKLSVFKSVISPILTYSHESWVMTERILSEVQAAEMGFLLRDHSVAQGYTNMAPKARKNSAPQL